MDFKYHPIQEYVRKIYHYLRPFQISTTRFNLLYDILQETRFSYCQPYNIYKITLGSIPNNWKHLRRTETSQKSFIKTFCYNNKATKSLIKSLNSKRLPKLSNKEIYLTVLYIPEEHHILSPDIWGKNLLIHNWFEECWWIAIYVYFLSCINLFFSLPLNPAIHRMGTAPHQFRRVG